MYGRRGRQTKEPIDESENSENNNHGLWSHHFMANRETMERVRGFFVLFCFVLFVCLFVFEEGICIITADCECSHKIKR